MSVKREKVHFESVDELLGAPVIKEGTEELKVADIYPFENHPFKVLDDEKMEDLVESIKTNGVLTPVIVRPDDEGAYEMISGHRRLHAAQRAGLNTIPAIIKPMTNDEAVIAMVDSNVQRYEILPSERAYALKMKMDAMKRQGLRNDLTSGADVNKPDISDVKIDVRLTSAHHERRLETADEVGKDNGISRAQVRRFIRLTELVPDLLDLVDKKRIGLVMAVDISYFGKDIQQWIYEYVKDNGFLKAEQIKALKEAPNIENMTQYTVIQVMNGALPEKHVNGKVSLSEKKLSKFFPPHMPSGKREEIILKLLEKWHKEQEENLK